MTRQKSNGLTLIRLLVVVLIGGIVAGLAVPNYSSMVERTKVKDAQGTLNIVYRAEGMYKLSYLGYGTLAQLVAGNYLDPNPSSDSNWTFTVTTSGGPPATSFNAEAARKAGSYSGKKVSLTEAWTGDVISADPYNGKKYAGDHDLHD